MRDHLTRIAAAVADHSVSVVQTQLLRQPTDHQDQMADQGVVVIAQRRQRRDRRLGITSTCVGACGAISAKARQCSSSKSISAGTSRSMIFPNTVLSLNSNSSTRSLLRPRRTAARAGCGVADAPVC